MNYKAFSEQDKEKARADITQFFYQVTGSAPPKAPTKPVDKITPKELDALLKKHTTAQEHFYRWDEKGYLE